MSGLGHRARSCRPYPRDGGAVTAELAVALPGLLVLMSAVASLGVAVQAQARCADAAYAAARVAARGETDDAVRAVAVRVAPTGAAVAVGARGDRVEVAVTAPVRLPLPGTPTLTASGRASALREAAP